MNRLKSARTSSYIGVLKSMLPELDIIYAVIKIDTDTYQVFEISRKEFEQRMFDPPSEKNKDRWFMKVKYIKSFRPVLKLINPFETEEV